MLREMLRLLLLKLLRGLPPGLLRGLLLGLLLGLISGLFNRLRNWLRVAIGDNLQGWPRGHLRFCRVPDGVDVLLLSLVARNVAGRLGAVGIERGAVGLEALW